MELQKYLEVAATAKVELLEATLLLKENIHGWLPSFCMVTTAKSFRVAEFSFPSTQLLPQPIVPKTLKNDRKSQVPKVI